MNYKFDREAVSDAGAFGKVVVLLGGTSSEREVSLKSGDAIYKSLKAQGVDAYKVDPANDLFDLFDVLSEATFDRAFIALHGSGGEDGTMQGALETLNIPYTGSGVLGSALAMDKVRSKQLWKGLELPTPSYAVYARGVSMDEVIGAVNLPVIVKPSGQGSSIGMSIAHDLQSLRTALEEAAKYDAEVLIEQWIQGAEYTVAVLGEQALPLIKLETAREFYDYEAKYLANDTRYICPCGLEVREEEAFQLLALDAFRSLGCQGWGRVDFMVDGQGEPWLLEVNTVPGMTDHSLVPMAAKAAGLSFDNLVWRILETTVAMGDQ